MPAAVILPNYSPVRNETGKQQISEITYRKLELTQINRNEIRNIIRKYKFDEKIKEKFNTRIYGHWFYKSKYDLIDMLLCSRVCLYKLKDVDELRNKKIIDKYEIVTF
jgi:hypothetical protein